MGFPRSIVVLLAVTLFAYVLVSRGRTTPSAPTLSAPTHSVPALQPAVLADGFAVMEGVGDRHVVEIDRNGARRRRSAIPTVTDTRVFGGPKGAGVGFLQRKKVHIARIQGDGQLGRSQEFGSSVRQLCDGLATNDQQWAMGWLEERDERLWFVHGPTSGTTQEVQTFGLADIDATLERATWCAVRSAGDYLAYAFRVGAKSFVLMCSVKECGVRTRMPIDPRDEVLDLACQREGCTVALRTREGATHLIAFTLRGKVAWKKPLPYAARDTTLQLAAVGDRAYTAAFMTNEGPVVERLLSKTGSTARVWQGAQGISSPVVVWSKGYAMLAYWDADALGHDVFAMPR